MPITDAERMRRSERAKAMHAAGVFRAAANGKKGGVKSGEVRRSRSSSAIAQEIFERHSDEIEKALTDALKRGTTNQKIKAAEVLSRLALSAQRTEQNAVQAAGQQRSREELLTHLSRSLTSGPAASILRAELEQKAEQNEDVIEAVVVEVPAED